MDLFKQTMKGPTRPAPGVPRLGVNRYSPVTDFNDDPFGTHLFEPAPNFTQKKKPPPRPPPPKHKTQPDIPVKPSHFIRRPTVLSSLLSRNKNNRNCSSANQNSNSYVQNPLTDLKLEDAPRLFPKCEVRAVQTGALIDLWSPPGSPTLTARSSSDGLSVDSFGSDATTSTSHHQPPRSASQPESGFEDDFDLCLNIPREDTMDDYRLDNIPKDDAMVDPFSPQPLAKPPIVKKSALNKDLLDISIGVVPVPNSNGPTIIRAKPVRPKPPDNSALLKTTFGNHFPVTSMNINTTTPIQKVNGFSDTFDLKPSTWEEQKEPPCIDWGADSSSSSPEREASPPMPSVPPPPPPEADWTADPVSAIDWPVANCPTADWSAVDRATDDWPAAKSQVSSTKDVPYAIALFDYSTGHPDDLCFAKNARIELLRRADGEWLYGRLHGAAAEGLFPASYVEIKVGLAGESGGPRIGTATALYDLRPEHSTDLPFSVGDTIVVHHRVSDQWYYGECNGATGHFPANYVQMH